MKRDEVQHMLTALVDLVSTAGMPSWRMSLGGVLRELEGSGCDPIRRQHAIRRIVALYQGGIGSFRDLVLQDSTGVRPEQDAFDLLRQRLFEAAREQLR